MSKELVMAQEFLRRLEKLEERVFPKNDEAADKVSCYRGKRVEDLTREELIEALNEAGWAIQRLYQEKNDEREMWSRELTWEMRNAMCGGRLFPLTK